nr:immunoglobulin light chain junction region [Macaca mulatta]
CQQESNWPYSF